MLRELFVNGCILIAAISLGNQIFKETGVALTDSVKSKVMIGLAGSLLGILLTVFSINLDYLLVLDFRAIATLLSAIYGGMVSALITSCIIAASRIILFGISKSSLVAFVNIITTGVGAGLISHTPLVKWKKWSLITVLIILVNSINFYVMLDHSLHLYYVILIFSVGIILVSMTLYFYSRYLEINNILFNNLKQEAKIDYLTGLNNVRQFDKVLNKTINSSVNDKQEVSLLFIDIDHFKKINDTFGHNSGDKLLKQFAEVLTENSRNKDMIFRIGGEEFSIILFDCSNVLAVEIAERIRQVVEKKTFKLSNGKYVNVTISIGVASYPENVVNISSIKEKADIALYCAKHIGRNTVENFKL